jgi:hypothetical protein
MYSLDVVSPNLRSALVSWYQDESNNYLLGYEKGPLGVVHFSADISDALESPAIGTVGVYYNAQPVGLISYVLRQPLEKYRTAKILFTLLEKDHRNSEGYSTTTHQMVSKLFDSGIYRVECEVPSIHKDFVNELRGLRFKQEGVKKSAYWIGHNAYNLIPLRILAPEWTSED